MTSKRLTVGLVTNILSFIISLSVSFIITPYLVSSLGKETYSFYPIANNFTSYFSIILLSVNSMASRFITISIAKKEELEAQKYISTVFISNVILMMFLALPMIYITMNCESLMDVPVESVHSIRVLFVYVFGALIMNTFASTFGISIFARNRMEYRGLIEIIIVITRGVLLLLFFTLLKPSIEILGLVLFIISLMNLIIQYGVYKKIFKNIKVRISFFSRKALKELVSAGMWNILFALGSILLSSFSLLMANTLIGVEAGGILAIVQVLPNMMTTIISSIYNVFLPRLTHVFAHGNKSNFIKELLFSQKILGILSTVPAMLLIIFGQEFYSLWMPNENSSMLQFYSVIVLIPMLIHGNMWTIYGTTIVMNKIKLPAILLAIVGGIYIFSVYVLLVVFEVGLVAIPIMTVLCHLIYYLIFMIVYVSKELDVNISTLYNHIFRTSVFIIILLIISRIYKMLYNITNWLEFFLIGGLFGAITLILYLVIVFEIGELKKILRNYIQRKERT